MSLRDTLDDSVKNLSEWYGVLRATSKLPSAKVLEDRKNHLTAVYDLCTEGGPLMTLQVNAGIKPFVALTGPYEHSLLVSGNVKREQVIGERILVYDNDKIINTLLYPLENGEPEKASINSTTLGGLWQKAHFSVTQLLEHDMPSYSAAERTLKTMMNALIHTRKCEYGARKLHLI